MIAGFVAAVTRLAIRLPIVGKGHITPTARAVVAGRTLTRIMIAWRIAAVARLAIRLPIVGKGHVAPTACAVVAG